MPHHFVNRLPIREGHLPDKPHTYFLWLERAVIQETFQRTKKRLRGSAMIKRTEIRKNYRIWVWTRPADARKIIRIEPAHQRVKTIARNFRVFFSRFIRHGRRDGKNHIGATHSRPNKPGFDGIGYAISVDREFMLQ